MAKIELLLNRITNSIGLVFGFALGQGSMFIAQTVLITRGALDAVGDFGLAFALLSLGTIVVDWGGTILLSRYAVHRHPDDYISAAAAVRLLVALPLSLASISWGLAHADGIIGGVLAAGALSYLPWAFNISGFFDGLGKSKIAGPLSGFSWLFASIGVISYIAYSQSRAAIIAGGLFSLGSATTVTIQYAIARRLGLGVTLMRPRYATARAYAIEGLKYNAGFLPAQAYSRVVISLVSAILGSSVSGLFVYAKSVANALSQGITFVRRVEFPTLVEYTLHGRHNLLRALSIQATSLATSLIAFGLVAVACLFLRPRLVMIDARLPEVIILIVALVPCWTVASALGQYAVAANKTHVYSLAMTATILLSLLIMVPALPRWQLSAVIGSELLMYASQVLVYTLLLRRAASSRATVQMP